MVAKTHIENRRNGRVLRHNSTWDCPLNTVESAAKGGEAATGTLRSSPFHIERSLLRFQIAGADGTTTHTNAGHLNHVLLRAWPTGEILRQERPPGTSDLTAAYWAVDDLIGRQVYLEIVDGKPALHPAGYA